ncbi:polysaccharide deacetylase family protein [Hymenobacter arcticus]
MYHALVERPAPYMAAVHVPIAYFAEQMAWLAAAGCRVLPLAEALASLRQPPGAAPVVALTFDDGYHSLYTHARPILAAHGFAATLFLTTAAVGEPSYAGQGEFARSAPAGDRPLRWVELRALQAAGWHIEAHGCSHRALAGQPVAAQLTELRGSRAAISRHLGRAPAYYAFPYGRYDRHTLRALAPAGYAAGFSVHTGPATPGSDPRRLPRIELTAACELATFRQLVATGYPSAAARHRARLRNYAYCVPLVKDALLGLAGRRVG